MNNDRDNKVKENNREKRGLLLLTMTSRFL